MLQLNSARFNRTDLPYFCYGDSRALYRENLHTQPADWTWRDQSIRYTLNTQGFRCPEFSDIDWASSIVCFGCSMTFGIGVDDNDTWVSQLGRELNCDTVNLAWPGASVSFMWANSVELIRAGITPRAVVYYWPEPSRVAEFTQPGRLFNWGVWEEQRQTRPWANSLGRAWIERDYHARKAAQLMIAGLHWPCPRLDLTWAWDGVYTGLAEHLHILEDRGRDLGHPGPHSQGQFARAVATRLKI